MQNKKFINFLYTPAGVCDGILAVAASRAGGVGVLNTELFENTDSVVDQLDFVASNTSGGYGLKIDRVDKRVLDVALSFKDKGLSWFIVDSEIFPDCRNMIPQFRRSGIKVLVELCTVIWPQDRSMEEEVDGIVLKGSEAGGFVGENSTFILFQNWSGQTKLPLFIRGGLTPYTAAAASAMGASGGVFDNQALLLEDSPFAPVLSGLLRNLAGNETVSVGDSEEGKFFRILKRPAAGGVTDFLLKTEGKTFDELSELVKKENRWFSTESGLFPVGQDVCFAGPWRKQYGRVASLFNAVDNAVKVGLAEAVDKMPFSEDSAFAKSLGTSLPVVQGPMARVSDCAEFAWAVYKEGGLPVLGLALMRGEPLQRLLEETASQFGDSPWGVGVLGFAPGELFDEQFDLIKKFGPTFAVLAGGRPAQYHRFEKIGVKAFLHVPVPDLLSMFLKDGCRRFIFEGRECGGHIGPINSLVLWSTMIERLLGDIKALKISPESVEVIFAGGIHDSFSSAFVQVLAAFLVKTGVRVGIIMGSAYLFTREIVESKAILKTYQEQVIKCRHTVSLESGAGHASRCADTPFTHYFVRKQRQLYKEKRSSKEIRKILDSLVMGRLRIASKGCERVEGAELCNIDERRQQEEGMYMVGQLAIIRKAATDIATLHREVTHDACDILQQRFNGFREDETTDPEPVDIAVIGMACRLPGADTPRQYWENILDGENFLDEIPAHRWDWRLYYDKDRNAKDKIYSRWGGFLNDMPFDPARYGMPPKSVESVDPMQLMALEVARQTLEDAGYAEKAFCRDKTSVIIGASGGTGDVGTQYGLRSEMPRFTGSLPEEVAKLLPEWTEDTFAGILQNVIAGRIANRLDLGSVNFTVDAACASSLAAVYQAVLELCSERSDMVIAGGVDTVQGPFGFMCFSKTQALSPTGKCKAFDAESDGIVISEGIAMVALKRLEDAKKDGDRIYAVIKGVGSSSDGRARGLTAPLPKGQVKAMRRAYERLDFGPESVDLFEAHGTGTVVGDTAELESTTSLLYEAGAPPLSAATGSVKTLIGHTKAAAGISGMLKMVLSLYHRTLPAHLGVENPNPIFIKERAPIYLLDKPRPWIFQKDRPRRSASSAFGFGGTNFHIVLEEYREEYRPWLYSALRDRWPCELLVWSGSDKDKLIEKLEKIRTFEGLSQLQLRDLAASLATVWKFEEDIVAIIAADVDDLMDKITSTVGYLKDSDKSLPAGVYHNKAMAEGGKLSVLFPGQGSQYLDMLRELALYFPVCTDTFSSADQVSYKNFSERFGSGSSLSRFIFPRGIYSKEAQKSAFNALTSTDVAQPAIGAVEVAIWNLAQKFGIKADMLGGHSYGEFTALHSSGIIDFETFISLSMIRGSLIADIGVSGRETGGMAAVMAPRDQVEKVTEELDDVTVANHNAPLQSVISGSKDSIDKAAKRFSEAGIKVTVLPVSAAFHSSFVEQARKGLADAIERSVWNTYHVPVYSNTIGDVHDADVSSVKQVMVDHLVKPLEFVSEIEAMYRDGARTFLELGPKSVLSRLVKKILDGRPCNVLSVDDEGGGITGLLHMLAQVICAGHPVDLEYLYTGRDCIVGDPTDLSKFLREKPLPDHIWMLNGSSVRKLNQPVKQVGVTVEDVKSLQAKRVIEKVSEKEIPSMDEKRNDSADNLELMQKYFDMMQRFLDTQERVMSLYLGDGGPVAGSSSPLRRRSHSLRVPSRRAAEFKPDTQPENFIIPQPQPSSTYAENKVGTDDNVALTQAPVVQEQAVKVEKVGEVAEKKSTSVVQAPAKDQMKALLLKIIEDKTGYPEDMIGMEQNLEADLGIDSIKRIEIVGTLLTELPESLAASVGEKERTQLNTQPDLKSMIEILEVIKAEGGDSRPFDNTGADLSETCAPGLPSRYVIEPVEEPLDGTAATHIAPGLFILTDDKKGVSAQLAYTLSKKGRKSVVVPAQALTDEEALIKWCESVDLKYGEVAGIIHTASLSANWLPLDTSLEIWRKELFRNEKTFFFLIRYFSNSFVDRAHIIGVSGLGGMFGRNGSPVSNLSIHGGGPGLVKSLFEERPDLRVKAVDIDLKRDISSICSNIISELELDGGRQEVGYPSGKRTVFKTVPAYIEENDSVLRDKLIVLATGGAKGITAEVLRELAFPGNVLLLVGRSDISKGEPDELKEFRSFSDLQHFFINQVQAGAMKLTPAEIKRKVNRILSVRELNNNIDDFKSKGAAVEYFSLDIVDETAVKGLFETIYEKYGRIDGIVHGAGIIEDKFLADKTSESWTRVVETKVLGLLLLQKFVVPEKLKFFFVFSSVAGRYGNSGQSDYATANEVMNRLCCQLSTIWPDSVNVKSFCWGPWGAVKFGAGMVTPETEKKFNEKGVYLVRAEEGRRLFLEELSMEKDVNVEIICGQGRWEEDEAGKAKIALNVSVPPFFSDMIINSEDGGAKSVAFTLGERHQYLKDHCLDGTPVLPAAAALEIMAEGVDHIWPELNVVEVRQCRMLNGIKVTDTRQNFKLLLDTPQYRNGDGLQVTAFLKSLHENGREIIHYRSVVCLEKGLPAGFLHKIPRYSGEELSVTKAYEKMLFHGPLFQVMEKISGLSEAGALVELRASDPVEWFSDITNEPKQWTFDPAVIDAAAQMAVLWTQIFRDGISLPVGFGRVTRFMDKLPSRFLMDFHHNPGKGSGTVSFDVVFTDTEGNALLQIENLESVASKALNRLGGTAHVDKV